MTIEEKWDVVCQGDPGNMRGLHSLSTANIAFSIELGIFVVILGCLAWLAQKFHASPSSSKSQITAARTVVAASSAATDNNVKDDESLANVGNNKTTSSSCRCSQDSATQTEPNYFFDANFTNDDDTTPCSSLINGVITELTGERFEHSENSAITSNLKEQQSVLRHRFNNSNNNPLVYEYQNQFEYSPTKPETPEPPSFLDYETDSELSSVYSIPLTMTTVPPPPPPPPPMPGTSGAFSMPNWRDDYQPIIREKAPSKEQIDKQQYAHLPDKLLNAMNKDKKPFTYTPSGVSSEKGVLDLSEIRSPRMKKRLLANLHAGEEEEDPEAYAAQQAKSPSSAPPAQYSASPLVLPPIPDSVQLRSPSPNSNRKEVRFAPSPIPMLACDDSEMLKKLAARKLDVEARATIVTNDPVGQDTVDNGAQQPQHFNNLNASQPNYQDSFEEDVDQICKNAADAVRTARGLADSQLVDQNNNNYEFSDDTMAELNNDFNKMRFNQPEMVPQKHQASHTSNNVGHQYQFDSLPNRNLNQPQQSVPNYNTDVLKHVLDAGLQDEIDKFEEMGAKMGSKSPENYYNPSHNNHLPPPLPARPISRPPPPPVPPRSNLNMYQDGRTSCPPFPNHPSEYQDQDFMNSFRCISPAIEILKKTQNTGYNYVTKPRPFYRAVDDESINQSNLNTNERMIPIRMEDRNGYSATLPRKIKLNQADPRQPKSYENPEMGRQYLPQAGMFSQLPPRPVMEDYSSESPGTPTQKNRMFFGINPKQPNQQQNFRSDNSRSYVDPEVGRQYLQQAEMFSQLPPQSSGQSDNDRYGFMKSRQTSLPPPPSVQINHQNNNNNNRSWTPGPQSPGTMTKQRLSLSELRRLPPSERPHEPPPMKYTGANIPSRSFRLLQLITGEDVPNQFVQDDDEQQQQQPQIRRARPPPPPVPPRSDSYRPASQQQQYFPNDPLERCASIPPNLHTNQATSSMSSVYASSSLGTDF